MRNAGYATRHVGKWHLAGDSYEGGGSPDGGFKECWYDLSNFYEDVGFDDCPEPERFGNWNRIDNDYD